MAGLALRPQYSYINTVSDADAATNVQVEQSQCVVPLDGQFAALLGLLRAHISKSGGEHKVIAFFTTARLTQFMAALANAAGIPVLEIHSRKSQSAREKASAEFRSARASILFSSDVSARGVDYPDVTMVLQVGEG